MHSSWVVYVTTPALLAAIDTLLRIIAPKKAPSFLNFKTQGRQRVFFTLGSTSDRSTILQLSSFSRSKFGKSAFSVAIFRPFPEDLRSWSGCVQARRLFCTGSSLLHCAEEVQVVYVSRQLYAQIFIFQL